MGQPKDIKAPRFKVRKGSGQQLVTDDVSDISSEPMSTYMSEAETEPENAPRFRVRKGSGQHLVCSDCSSDPSFSEPSRASKTSQFRDLVASVCDKDLVSNWWSIPIIRATTRQNLSN